MNPGLIVALMFLAVIVLFVLRTPVAFTLGIMGIGSLLLLNGPRFLLMLPPSILETMTSIILRDWRCLPRQERAALCGSQPERRCGAYRHGRHGHIRPGVYRSQIPVGAHRHRRTGTHPTDRPSANPFRRHGFSLPKPGAAPGLSLPPRGWHAQYFRDHGSERQNTCR